MASSRVLLKLLIHNTLDMVDRVKAASMEATEHVRDLLAEVEAEREAERQRREGEGEEATEAVSGDTPDAGQDSEAIPDREASST